MSDTARPRSVAIVTCSTRPCRIGHLIADYVAANLDAALSASLHAATHARIASIDLAKTPLPLLDEPGIPQAHPAANPTPHYTHAHTRAWSTTVRENDAFVFVTPQYNWGYPASIKNALDYLYHEWTGKPAMVVSYGGRGGGLAAAQLVQVCKGLRMKAIEKTVGIKISVDEADNARDKGYFSQERVQTWKEDGVDEQLKLVCDELFVLLEEMSA